jgi:hypothetical protein
MEWEDAVGNRPLGGFGAGARKFSLPDFVVRNHCRRPPLRHGVGRESDKPAEEMVAP